MRRFARARAWLSCCAISGLAVADDGMLARTGDLGIDTRAFVERASRVAALDWPTLGASWPERRRRLLEDVMLGEVLLPLAAGERKALPSARDRALAMALSAELARETSRATPTDAEVQAYIERHRRELETPRSITIWRILLGSDAEARASITKLQPPTEAEFSRLARENSLDRATQMRAGNLGEVYADGDTRVPELRVAPALFAAADRVADGQLVPEPVPEGDGFAVVWRRASRTREAPAADVPARVAERLAEERQGRVMNELLAGLRRERLHEHHPELAAAFEPTLVEPPLRPATRSAAPEALYPARLVPRLTERGLR